MKKMIMVIVALFFISGCTSMQDLNTFKEALIDGLTLRRDIPSEDTLIPLFPFKVQLSYIYFPLRADLFRQEKKTGESKTEYGCVTVTSDEYEDMPYACAGLSLGNGLFADMNGNLSLDFAEITGFSKMENCTLTIYNQNLVSSKTVIIKRGKTVTISESNPFEKDQKILFKDGETVVDRGLFSFKRKIKMSDTSVTYNPGGILNFYNKEKIIKKDDEFVVPGFFIDHTIAKLWGDGVLIYGQSGGSDLSITASGKKISISDYTFARSRDRIVFYDNTLLTGIKVDIRENEFICTEVRGLSISSISMKLEQN